MVKSNVILVLKYKYSLCHCNLNILTAHDFPKVGTFEAVHNPDEFNIKCLLEIYLDSKTFNSNDNNLGHRLTCTYYLKNIKPDGAHLYSTETFPIRVIQISHL